MVILPSIFTLLNQRKNRILRIAEAALPERQFQAFRSCLLDELGREGFERDVERLVAERETRDGQGRPIRAKEGGAP